MHRWLPIIVGPELVMLLINVAVYLFCARHTAGESRFVGVLVLMVYVNVQDFVNPSIDFTDLTPTP